jgi:hypothetical protein
MTETNPNQVADAQHAAVGIQANAVARMKSLQVVEYIDCSDAERAGSELHRLRRNCVDRAERRC